MVNKPKNIGTRFETQCVDAFREAGFDARRLALAGAKDQGDVELFAHGIVYVVECKCHKTWTRKDIKEWRKQALEERWNYATTHNLQAMHIPALIVSQYGKSLSESYVHTIGSTQNFDSLQWIQMYLDEFVDGLLRADSICRSK